MARALLIDVRNGLIYGLLEIKQRGPDHAWPPAAYFGEILARDREQMRFRLYQELAEKTVALIAQAKGRKEEGK
jgi:hypothetical protein